MEVVYTQKKKNHFIFQSLRQIPNSTTTDPPKKIILEPPLHNWLLLIFLTKTFKIQIIPPSYYCNYHIIIIFFLSFAIQIKININHQSF